MHVCTHAWGNVASIASGNPFSRRRCARPAPGARIATSTARPRNGSAAPAPGGGGAQAAQAQLPHTARARRRGAGARMTDRLRALPSFSRCAAAGSLPAPVVTFAWTPLIDRAAATLAPAGSPDQPSCRRPRRTAGPRTEIRLGARAHTDRVPTRAHAPSTLQSRHPIATAPRLTQVPAQMRSVAPPRLRCVRRRSVRQ